jgi:hypothetical protein
MADFQHSASGSVFYYQNIGYREFVVRPRMSAMRNQMAMSRRMDCVRYV